MVWVGILMYGLFVMIVIDIINWMEVIFNIDLCFVSIIVVEFNGL